MGQGGQHNLGQDEGEDGHDISKVRLHKWGQNEGQDGYDVG